MCSGIELCAGWWHDFISRTTFFHLRNIAKIRHILSQQDAEKLVHAFVTSRLDYCNSLFSGCPNTILKTLRLIQNAAVRVLTRSNTRDHISPILASLHWLPVKFRVQFKILVFTYKASHGQSPSSVPSEQLMVPYRPSITLGSQDVGLLVIPKSPKVEGEAEPSAIKLLSCRTIVKSLCRRQTQSINQSIRILYLYQWKLPLLQLLLLII